MIYLAKHFAQEFAVLLAADLVANAQKYEHRYFGRGSSAYESESFEIKFHYSGLITESKTGFKAKFWSKILLRHAIKKWRVKVFEFSK